MSDERFGDGFGDGSCRRRVTRDAHSVRLLAENIHLCDGVDTATGTRTGPQPTCRHAERPCSRSRSIVDCAGRRTDELTVTEEPNFAVLGALTANVPFQYSHSASRANAVGLPAASRMPGGNVTQCSLLTGAGIPAFDMVGTQTCHRP